MTERTIEQIENEMRAENKVVPSEENGWRGPDDTAILRLQTERDRLIIHQLQAEKAALEAELLKAQDGAL